MFSCSLDFQKTIKFEYYMKNNQHSYKLPVTVEFEDIDSYQIVHHTKLIAYLERTRVRFFSNLGLDLLKSDVNFVLRKMDMRFLKTAKLLDELMITVFLDTIDSTHIILGYRINNGRALIAKAKTELACIDSQTLMISPIPKKLLNILMT